MALLSVANLVYSLGDRPLIAGINLTLDQGEHVGMVGQNGCGKSTLLKLIAGLGNLRHDSGQIQLARGATAGYLTQDPVLDPNRTLRDEADTAFAHLHALHEKLHNVAQQMTTAQGEELDLLLKQYEKVEEQVQAAGGYAIDHQIDATLHGLGLTDELFNVPVSGLSGGQKGRLALAKLLLSGPDLLLLDEPTNHLDIAGRQWLEEFLSTYRGAVIVVSHDRWLLDRVVTRIYEMDRGTLEQYPGNYQKFRELRILRRLTQEREHEKHQDHVRREQAFIDRYRAGQRARQAQGREKRLDRLRAENTTERPPELDVMNLRLRPIARSGDIVAAADNLSKNYDRKPLFANLSLVIKRGHRIGIIGPNGAGKTTLTNCLLGKMEPDSGVGKLGAQVDVGYYRQTHEHLDQNQSIVDYLRRLVSSGTEQEARDLAGAFLFGGMDQDKMLSSLSGGERSRAVLAGLIAGGHNLLVLDEPTNHLDIPSAERLEEALLRFTAEPASWGENTTGGGTLILITHDRMLLEQLVDQLLILDGKGNCRLFQGRYSEYLASEAAASKAAAAASDKAARPASAPKASTAPRASTAPQPSQKHSNQKQPARSSGNPALTKLSSPALEKQIVQTEQKLAQIDQQLADPDSYRHGDKVKRLQQERESLRATLTPLEEEWLRRAEK